MSHGFRPHSRIVWATAVAALACGADPGPAKADPLRVGTSGDYAPFSQGRTDGEGGFDTDLAGFDVEVARAFARDRGLEVQFVHFRWPELLTALAEARFDLAMSGITVRADRSLAGRFSVPVARSGAMLIVRKPDGGQPLEFFDDEQVTLAVNRGGHLERVTREQFPRATVRPVEDNENVLGELLAGRSRAVVTDTLEAPHWLGRGSNLIAIGPFTSDEKAALLRPERVELARELDTWLLARERDGTLRQLRAKHFGPDSQQATATPDRALEAASTERLALMPFVAEAKRKSHAPIEDRARERTVLAAARASVERAARERGVAPPDPEAVTAFFRAQIAEAKRVQQRVLEQPSGPSRPQVDLVATIRPALIRIGDRIAMLLVERAVERRAEQPISRTPNGSDDGESP